VAAKKRRNGAALRRGEAQRRKSVAPFVLCVKGVTKFDILAFKGKAQIRMYMDSSRNTYETDKGDHSGKRTLPLN